MRMSERPGAAPDLPPIDMHDEPRFAGGSDSIRNKEEAFHEPATDDRSRVSAARP